MQYIDKRDQVRAVGLPRAPLAPPENLPGAGIDVEPVETQRMGFAAGCIDARLDPHFIGGAGQPAQWHQTHAQAWVGLLDAPGQRLRAQWRRRRRHAQQVRVEPGVDFRPEHQKTAGEGEHQQKNQYRQAKIAMQRHPELARHGQLTSGACS